VTLALFDASDSKDRALSQWFTPAWLARRLVAWGGSLRLQHVIEPSAGSGELVAAILESMGPDDELGSVTAFELDPRWVAHLRGRFPMGVEVYEADFLGAHNRLSLTYDVALLNPPYERQLDVAFLRRAMSLALECRGIFRLAFLANRGTRAAIAERGHVLRRVAMLGRVKFDGDGDGTPVSDFVAIETSRAKPGEAPGCEGAVIEWWEGP
jgi:predicted RNA methylase